jgi:hypothetical protein
VIIELQRAFTPEDMVEEKCGVCELPFRVESVVAVAMARGRMDSGWACESCVEYLGERNPAHFPTIAEYRAALGRYPEPIWSTEEEARRAEENKAAYGRAYAASWIRR